MSRSPDLHPTTKRARRSEGDSPVGFTDLPSRVPYVRTMLFEWDLIECTPMFPQLRQLFSKLGHSTALFYQDYPACGDALFRFQYIEGMLNIPSCHGLTLKQMLQHAQHFNPVFLHNFLHFLYSDHFYASPTDATYPNSTELAAKIIKSVNRLAKTENPLNLPSKAAEFQCTKICHDLKLSKQQIENGLTRRLLNDDPIDIVLFNLVTLIHSSTRRTVLTHSSIPIAKIIGLLSDERSIAYAVDLLTLMHHIPLSPFLLSTSPKSSSWPSQLINTGFITSQHLCGFKSAMQHQKFREMIIALSQHNRVQLLFVLKDIARTISHLCATHTTESIKEACYTRLMRYHPDHFSSELVTRYKFPKKLLAHYYKAKDENSWRINTTLFSLNSHNITPASKASRRLTAIDFMLRHFTHMQLLAAAEEPSTMLQLLSVLYYCKLPEIRRRLTAYNKNILEINGEPIDHWLFTMPDETNQRDLTLLEPALQSWTAAGIIELFPANQQWQTFTDTLSMLENALFEIDFTYVCATPIFRPKPQAEPDAIDWSALDTLDPANTSDTDILLLERPRSPLLFEVNPRQNKDIPPAFDMDGDTPTINNITMS